jgi:hypothetical protein
MEGCRLRIFKSKWFNRYARKEDIDDAKLCESIQDADNGNIYADLGGGVIKQKISRLNEGKSGGYRTIILYRKKDIAVFMFGFAKSDEDNIGKEEVRVYKTLAIQVLGMTVPELEKQVKAGNFIEVKYHDRKN